MIILYGPDEKEFKSNGFGDLSKYIFDDEVYEEINGIFKFEFSYPMFAPLAQDLKMDNTIRVETPTGEQPFFIIKSNNTNGYIKITAYHIFYKLVWELIEHIGIVNLSAQDGLGRILENTGYTGQSNMTNKSTVTIVRYNVVQALLDNTKDNTFISRYGGEIIRDKFNIEFKTQIGRKYVNNPVEIAYAKNLESYEVELDSSNVATRVMPQGFDGLLLPEKYVLKPGATKIKTLHKEYPHIKAAKDGEDIAEDELPLTEAYEALRNAVLDDFEAGVFDIQANYKISHQELSTTEEYKNKAVLETIYLGDEIRVKHTDEDIDILGRVISYRWKPTTKEYLETELGNYIPKFSNLTTLITMIEGKVQESKDFLEAEIDLVTALLNSALGGHVFARNGELFIMDTDDPMTAQKIWRWNLNGLGYSSTGINGPYGTAITMDGTIIGDYIAVNSLAAISANLGTIKAGRIQSKDNSSFWDLDSGKIELNVNELRIQSKSVATQEDSETISIEVVNEKAKYKNSVLNSDWFLPGYTKRTSTSITIEEDKNAGTVYGYSLLSGAFGLRLPLDGLVLSDKYTLWLGAYTKTAPVTSVFARLEDANGQILTDTVFITHAGSASQKYQLTRNAVNIDVPIAFLVLGFSSLTTPTPAGLKLFPKQVALTEGDIADLSWSKSYLNNSGSSLRFGLDNLTLSGSKIILDGDTIIDTAFADKINTQLLVSKMITTGILKGDGVWWNLDDSGAGLYSFNSDKSLITRLVNGAVRTVYNGSRATEMDNWGLRIYDTATGGTLISRLVHKIHEELTKEVTALIHHLDYPLAIQYPQQEGGPYSDYVLFDFKNNGGSLFKAPAKFQAGAIEKIGSSEYEYLSSRRIRRLRVNTTFTSGSATVPYGFTMGTTQYPPIANVNVTGATLDCIIMNVKPGTSSLTIYALNKDTMMGYNGTVAVMIGLQA